MTELSPDGYCHHQVAQLDTLPSPSPDGVVLPVPSVRRNPAGSAEAT